MKYLKKFNEERAIGFRYSEPTVKFILSFEAEEPHKEEEFKLFLDDLKISYDEVSYDEYNDFYTIKFRVYTDSEVDYVINGLIKKSIRSSIDIDVDSINVDPRDY